MQHISSSILPYAKSSAVVIGLGLAFVCYNTFSDGNLEASGRRLLQTKEGCTGDTLLPIFPSEESWVIPLRAFLYLLALGWFFLGVAISADTFMSAIEVITAKTKTTIVNGQEVEVEVWNGTVANLTLMALGSSAPEILLAVVEIVSKQFEAGDLGPGTIVGSAAFNLLFITAICIVSLDPLEEDPNTLESRVIEEYGVFVITAIFSLFAYFWMVIVLEFISKNEVELWEALLTLLFFPILVGISYGQDAAWFGMCGDASVSPEEHHTHITGIVGPDGKHRRPSQTVNPEAAEEAEEAPAEEKKDSAEDMSIKKKKKSRLEYRIQATRKMTGGKRSNAAKKEESEAAMSAEVATSEMVLGFAQSTYSELESCGTVHIKVVREGTIDQPCTVQFDTSDGTAHSGNEYVQTQGVVTFKPDQTEQEIQVEIIDDNEWAPDKHFFIRLFNPSQEVSRLTMATTQVIILNDDNPGMASFKSKTVQVSVTAQTVEVPLERKEGNDGNLLVFVKTTDGTAKGGVDFEELTEDQEEIHFEDKQMEAKIAIKLKPNAQIQNKSFSLTINSVEPEGAQIGEPKTVTVIISNDQQYQKMIEQVVDMLDEDAAEEESSSWADQFTDAMNLGVEDDASPECMDYVLHLLSFYWKVLHACIPPADYCGGWLTFWFSLMAIGALTAVIGDLAKMFGCCVGLKDGITAITFVALGTSLPDTFASVEATKSDETADAAITNVTGSNSVNVFLGLGLPWTLACVYHLPDTLAYPAGDLVFSVFVFFAFAVVCIALLTIRRWYFDGELGGPKTFAWASSTYLAFSWLFYVVISAMKAEGDI